MSLTQGQKKVKNAERQLAQSVSNPAEIKRLLQSRFAYGNAYHLLRRSEVWQIVKPLLGTIYHVKQDDMEVLAENSALSDAELIELGVAGAEPLKVLKHPNCGDLTLKKVAELWHSCSRGKSLDCVSRWATDEQIQRMYELHPPCRESNPPLGYEEFARRLAS